MRVRATALRQRRTAIPLGDGQFSNGYDATFTVPGKKTNFTVMQNIQSKLQSYSPSGQFDEKSYEFTEAFRKGKGQVIDTFAVPVEWRRNQCGTFDIFAEAWAVPNFTWKGSGFKKGKPGVNPWGNAYGSERLREPGKVCTRKRHVRISWDNVNTKRTDQQLRAGEDLKLGEQSIKSSSECSEPFLSADDDDSDLFCL